MERRSGIAEDELAEGEIQVLSIGLSWTITEQPPADHRPQIAVDRQAQIPAGGTGSVAKCRGAPTNAVSIPILVDDGEIGSVEFGAGATVGTFVLPQLMLNPTQLIALLFPAVPDLTFADIAITIQANRGDEPGTEPGDVASVFGRTGGVLAEPGDYNSDLVENTSTVAGGSVSDALETLSALGGAEGIQDTVAAMFAGGLHTNLTFVYDDATGVLSAEVLAANVNEYRGGASGKVLTGSQVWLAANEVAIAYAANIAPDMSTFINASVLLTGPCLLDNPTNTKAQSGYIRFQQDATGSRVVTFGANWEFASGNIPVLSTGANAEDLLFYQVLSATRIYASLVKAVA